MRERLVAHAAWPPHDPEVAAGNFSAWFRRTRGEIIEHAANRGHNVVWTEERDGRERTIGMAFVRPAREDSAAQVEPRSTPAASEAVPDVAEPVPTTSSEPVPALPESIAALYADGGLVPTRMLHEALLNSGLATTTKEAAQLVSSFRHAGLLHRHRQRGAQFYAIPGSEADLRGIPVERRTRQPGRQPLTSTEIGLAEHVLSRLFTQLSNAENRHTVGQTALARKLTKDQLIKKMEDSTYRTTVRRLVAWGIVERQETGHGIHLRLAPGAAALWAKDPQALLKGLSR